MKKFTVGAAMLTAVVSLPASAATITHHAQALSYGAPAANSEQINANGNSASAATAFSTPFVWGSSSTTQDASFAGSASANLSEGAIRAASAVENRQPISGPVLAFGERQHMNYSEARIGDTFTIGITDPAVVYTGAKATLKLDIHGTFTTTGDIDFASVYEQWGAQYTYNSFQFSSGLTVRQAGGFDLFHQANTLDPDDFASFEEYLDAFYALNDAYAASLIAGTGIAQHSNQAYLDSTFQLPTWTYELAETGEVMASLLLEIDLSNIDDTVFEWEASLWTRVILDSSTLNASINADFGNTAILSLILPQGFALTSASDAFPQSNVTYADATSVSEPATLALIGFGLMGVAVARRRKSA